MPSLELAGQLAGAAFVVDSKSEDHYKETVRGICETIRVAKDFKHEVAKPVSKVTAIRIRSGKKK